jgi:hypothetical protein
MRPPPAAQSGLPAAGGRRGRDRAGAAVLSARPVTLRLVLGGSVASGVGYTTNPLGQALPHTLTNPQINPHNLSGPKRVNPLNPPCPQNPQHPAPPRARAVHGTDGRSFLATSMANPSAAPLPTPCGDAS